MTQKNFTSVRALTMEEMENVNGGVRVKTQTGEIELRKNGFGIRVK